MILMENNFDGNAEMNFNVKNEWWCLNEWKMWM